MPSRTTATLLLLCALGTATGCARRYVIQGDEARFAAETLQTRKTVRVTATEQRSGRPVFIELRARDRGRVRFELDDPDVPAERHVLSRLGEDVEFTERIEVSLKNFGPVFWGTGTGIFAAGWLISVMSAVSYEDGTLAIPVVGPALQYYDAISSDPECMNDEYDDDPTCGWSEALGALAAATALTAELVGLGLVIAGAVVQVRNDREVDGSDRPADWVQWRPFGAPLERGGIVGGVVARFW